MNRRHLLAAGGIAGVLALMPFAAFSTLANEEKSDRDAARAMVDDAITLFRTKGAQAAIAAVNMPATKFLKGDLYVFIIGPNGRIVAHGFDHSRIGLQVAGLVDMDGKHYGRQILKATTGGKWVDYKWVEPTTRKFAPKSSWVKRYDDYIFGCGVYRPA